MEYNSITTRTRSQTKYEYPLQISLGENIERINVACFLVLPKYLAFAFTVPQDTLTFQYISSAAGIICCLFEAGCDPRSHPSTLNTFSRRKDHKAHDPRYTLTHQSTRARTFGLDCAASFRGGNIRRRLFLNNPTNALQRDITELPRVAQGPVWVSSTVCLNLNIHIAALMLLPNRATA